MDEETTTNNAAGIATIIEKDHHLLKEDDLVHLQRSRIPQEEAAGDKSFSKLRVLFVSTAKFSLINFIISEMLYNISSLSIMSQSGKKSLSAIFIIEFTTSQ